MGGMPMSPSTTAGLAQNPWRCVLLVTSNQRDRDSLDSVLENTRWRVEPAASTEEAIQRLRAVPFSVVLWDRDAAGADWKDGLRRLAGVSHRPAVLLLSEVADPYLWEEVIRAGGFEVMTRPFRRNETLAALEFAHRHWEASLRKL